ncbi:MAG: hypothetical protein KAY24_05440 [Candidatus Eisenbacteria sp.]|nr:hypothetical protein [Candidatus Eisenbacteria bacterium]
MNPFKYGQVVSAGDFCPRPVLLKDLVACIKSGQNVVLQGERRMGKTSLITRVLENTTFDERNVMDQPHAAVGSGVSRPLRGRARASPVRS